MHQISSEDSGTLSIKNTKTNNNIAGYHLFSDRAISAPSDVPHVYRCSKKTFLLPQKDNVSVSNI